MIKIGILGCGAFGREFIPLFRNHPLVSSVALCDQVADKLSAAAAELGIARTFASYPAMLASDVDAVAVITQHWMHAPQAIQALRAGKDAYSAVPTAASIQEVHDLERAVRETGRIYMMGETSAYYHEAIHCRERFARGEFGSMVYAQSEYFHDWDHGLYEVAERRSGPGWRAMAAKWAPMSYPTHSVGMVISVTGAHARSVSCVGVRDTKVSDRDIYPDKTNPFSNEIALMELSDGSAMRICEMRRIGHPGAERMQLYGTEGAFERTSDARLWCTKRGVERIDPIFAHDHPEMARRSARLPAALRGNGGHGGSHAFLVDDFVKACAWRLQPRVNIYQAARYFLPGLIAHESSLAGGMRMTVPDLGDGPAVDHAAFERCVDQQAGAAR